MQPITSNIPIKRFVKRFSGQPFVTKNSQPVPLFAADSFVKAKKQKTVVVPKLALLSLLGLLGGCSSPFVREPEAKPLVSQKTDEENCQRWTAILSPADVLKRRALAPITLNGRLRQKGQLHESRLVLEPTPGVYGQPSKQLYFHPELSPNFNQAQEILKKACAAEADETALLPVEVTGYPSEGQKLIVTDVTFLPTEKRPEDKNLETPKSKPPKKLEEPERPPTRKIPRKWKSAYYKVADF